MFDLPLLGSLFDQGRRNEQDCLGAPQYRVNEIIITRRPTNCDTLKRPSHGKLKLANSCWQTQVGVCERHKNSRQTLSNVVKLLADCFYAVHTNQLEFANFSLLCEGRLKPWSNR